MSPSNLPTHVALRLAEHEHALRSGDRHHAVHAADRRARSRRRWLRP
ncbi:hypothetical protein [Nocardioides sp. CFH 31398]|nr:hypothetical protein [Nocardioides sp. CFH 31398]MCH1866405.1 hypothetical protein [Nocardioides sp. CFH 31398]